MLHLQELVIEVPDSGFSLSGFPESLSPSVGHGAQLSVFPPGEARAPTRARPGASGLRRAAPSG